METEDSSHLWPSPRVCYLLEGRGLITTTWAKSAQMVLLILLSSAQNRVPPEVSASTKALSFPELPPSPMPDPTPPLPPLQRSLSSNCNPDMNSNLKIVRDHPFLRLCPRQASGAPFFNIQPHLWRLPGKKEDSPGSSFRNIWFILKV